MKVHPRAAQEAHELVGLKLGFSGLGRAITNSLSLGPHQSPSSLHSPLRPPRQPPPSTARAGLRRRRRRTIQARPCRRKVVRGMALPSSIRCCCCQPATVWGRPFVRARAARARRSGEEEASFFLAAATARRVEIEVRLGFIASRDLFRPA